MRLLLLLSAADVFIHGGLQHPAHSVRHVRTCVFVIEGRFCMWAYAAQHAGVDSRELEVNCQLVTVHFIVWG